MSRVLSGTWWCLLLTFVGINSSKADDERQEFTLDAIVQGWAERAERMHSGEFRWTERVWYRKGSMMSASEGHVVPREDRTVTRQRSFVFSRSRIRLEAQGEYWNDSTKQFENQKSLGVWEDRSSLFRQFFQFDTEMPRGHVCDYNWAMAHDVGYWPFYLGFRMLDSSWRQFDPKEYTLSSRQEVMDGRVQLLVQTSPKVLAERKSTGSTPVVRSFWVSPEENFVVTRYTAGLLNRPPDQELTLSYVQHPEHGWYPTEWRYVMGGSPYQIHEGKVTEFLLNQPVEPSKFAFQFPEGTWVHDLRKDGFRPYIVRGHDERPVLAAELRAGLRYKDLLRTEPGELLGPTRSGRWTWLLLANAVALSILAVFVVIGRNRARHQNLQKKGVPQ